MPVSPLGKDRVRVAIEPQEGLAPQQPREIKVLVLERLCDRMNRDQPGWLREVLSVFYSVERCPLGRVRTRPGIISYKFRPYAEADFLGRKKPEK